MQDWLYFLVVDTGLRFSYVGTKGEMGHLLRYLIWIHLVD